MPNVPQLTHIWAPGAESGKRFARVYNRLLVGEATTRGLLYHAVDDSAGDYRGVDGYSEGGFFTSKGKEGFSFKFYASPLKDNHKAEITESLLAAMKQFSELQFWTLCTPATFYPQDIAWFEKLEQERKPPFRIWHWGFEEFLGYLQKHDHVGREVYPNLFAATEDERSHFTKLREYCIAPVLNDMSIFEDLLQFRGRPYTIIEVPKEIKSASVRTPVQIKRRAAFARIEFLHGLKQSNCAVLLEDFLQNHFREHTEGFIALEKALEAFANSCIDLAEQSAARILQAGNLHDLADWSIATPPKLFHLNVGDYVARRLLGVYGGSEALSFSEEKLSYQGGTVTLFTSTPADQEHLANLIQNTQDSLELVTYAQDIHRNARKLLTRLHVLKTELTAFQFYERLPGSCRFT